jgi:transcription elongation factor Elf1
MPTAEKQQIKYRFFCPHCTGRALYAKEKYKFYSVVCRNCQKEVLYDENGWFEVTDPDELRKVNA